MQPISKLFMLPFVVVFALAVLLSCDGKEENVDATGDIAAVPASLSVAISGTFSGLSSNEIAWGKFGVLYAFDNADALQAFNSWKDGNDRPDCEIFSKVKTTAGGTVTAVISGLKPETTYFYCVFFESPKGERHTTSVGSFTTNRFQGTISAPEARNVRYYTSELSGNIQGIDKTDQDNCRIGFRVVKKGEDLSKADVSIATVDSEGNATLKMKGLSHSTEYICQPVIVVGDNFEIVEGEASSFLTRDVDEMAVDLGLSVKWASCDFLAEEPMEDGECFAWGELVPNHKGTIEAYTYYRDGSYVDIGDEISGTEYDVVHMTLGGKWRMPTADEVKELFENCSVGYDIEFTNDINAAITITAKGDYTKTITMGMNTLYYTEGSAKRNRSVWTGSARSVEDISRAITFYPSKLVEGYTLDYRRYYSFPIRPVCEY